jgi:tripeptidyl-peptidase-2
MNGTSMSSPNCCGCVSLLISAMKSENIQYSPYMIKTAIKNTSKNIKDPMMAGLLQVEKAFQYLVNSKDYLPAKLNFNLKVGNDRGIYLRDHIQTYSKKEFSINVTPVFPNSENPETNKIKVNLELQIALQSSQSWLK